MTKIFYLICFLLIGGFITVILLVIIIAKICSYRQRLKRHTRQRSVSHGSSIVTPHSSSLYTISDESIPISSNRAYSSRHSSVCTQLCQRKILCNEFVQKYLSGLHKAYLNPIFDRCYCTACAPKLICQRFIAGYMHTKSQGWYRLGLNVDNALAEGQDIWRSWATSYHGTSINKAISIVKHRQLLIPGDISNDNQPISIVHGTKTAYYYTTPCIRYASLETYSRSVLFNSNITGESYKVKVIVQLKQKPGSFSVHRGTIPYFYPPNPPVCTIIKHDQLEWYSNARSSTVPYGLLFKFERIPSLEENNLCKSRSETISSGHMESSVL